MIFLKTFSFKLAIPRLHLKKTPLHALAGDSRRASSQCGLFSHKPGSSLHGDRASDKVTFPTLMWGRCVQTLSGDTPGLTRRDGFRCPHWLWNLGLAVVSACNLRWTQSSPSSPTSSYHAALKSPPQVEALGQKAF